MVIDNRIFEITAGGSDLAGLGVQYWFGFALVGAAVVLVLTQAWVSIHPPEVVAADEAKKKLVEAASQARKAADTAKQAAGTLAGVRALLDSNDPEVTTGLSRMSPQQQSLIRSAATQGNDAEAAADEADKAASEAEDAVSDVQSFLGVANTVASKLPLVGGAVLLAAMGCAVAGFIDISFG